MTRWVVLKFECSQDTAFACAREVGKITEQEFPGAEISEIEVTRDEFTERGLNVTVSGKRDGEFFNWTYSFTENDE